MKTLRSRLYRTGKVIQVCHEIREVVFTQANVQHICCSNGTARFEKCEQLLEYQNNLLASGG